MGSAIQPKDNGPNPGIEEPEKKEPLKTRYVSLHNKTAIDKCIAQLQTCIATGDDVTPISGPSRNAWGQLASIKVGQLLSSGVENYTAAWKGFDIAFAEKGPGAQGGIPAAVEIILLQRKTRVNVLQESERLEAKLVKEYEKLLEYRGEANLSLEQHYDER